MEKTSEFKEFTSDLSFKLRVMRDITGLNQPELANKIGICGSSIGLYESGRETANLLYLSRMANLCGITLDDYLLTKAEFVKKLYGM